MAIKKIEPATGLPYLNHLRQYKLEDRFLDIFKNKPIRSTAEAWWLAVIDVLSDEYTLKPNDDADQGSNNGDKT